MWLKILKYVVVISRAVGLDKKVQVWVNNRLNGIEKRVIEVDNEISRDIPRED